MKAQELINNLTTYVNQAPNNSHAEVKLLSREGLIYDVEGGNDGRGMLNEHYLILVPNLGSGIGVKNLGGQ